MSPDPVMEKYYGVNPYGYCTDNPINVTDNDGRLPIPNLIGAAAGAAFEYTGQVAGNFFGGKRGWDAFIDVDVSDIIVAAGEGFITSGASVGKSIAKRAAITLGAEVIRNTVNYNVKDNNLSINNIDEIVIGTTIGVFFGSFEGPSSSSTFKKTSVNKQVEAAKAAAHSEGRKVPAKEARQMNIDAKTRNNLTDIVNASIEEEEKKAIGHFFGTGFNTYIWNGKKE